MSYDAEGNAITNCLGSLVAFHLMSLLGAWKFGNAMQEGRSPDKEVSAEGLKASVVILNWKRRDNVKMILEAMVSAFPK